MGVVRFRTSVLVALLSLVTGVTVTLAPPALAGVTINVPGNQPTIQAGIDAAAAGDTVVVAPGTYVENIDFKGKAITVRAQAFSNEPTVIDGGGTAPVVTFKSGEGRRSVLHGFKITRGAIGAPDLIAGAGIAIEDSSPTITQNFITDNDAGGHAGGGIGAVGGFALIQDNSITSNRTTGNGAGIFAGGATEIVQNDISNNTAGGGGGVFVY